ncbi:MAG: WbqC family protein [Bacteroidales bacterium]|nr:WbqC family protein [Bacteroidales bacterium]
MTPIFPTAYFPPITYMANMLRYSKVVIEVHETYPKQTIRNRALIMTSSGVFPLIVPVSRPNGNHTPTHAVEISYHERWNIIHLRTLQTAYNTSPYYLYYCDELEALLTSHYHHLIDLNKSLTLWCLQKIKAPCEIVFSTHFTPHSSTHNDFRLQFSSKHQSPNPQLTPYYQVFSDRIPFTPNLSVLDLLMNLGPDARHYLDNISRPQQSISTN